MLNLLTSGSRVSVNIFMFISCYFMAKPGYKAKGNKVTGTYFMLRFYSVVLGIIAMVISKEFNLKIIKAFFPLFGGALWYMTMYIVFLLLFPFVSQVKFLDRKKHKLLAIIGGAAFCVYSSLHRFQEGMLGYFGWIILCYICSLYYAKYLEGKVRMVYITFGAMLGAIVYLTLVWVKYYSNSETIISYAEYYLSEMTTLPNTFIALFIVLVATRINIGSISGINKISGCMGAIYIAHGLEAFYPILWECICRFKDTYLKEIGTITMLLLTFIVFSMLVFVIEVVRRQFWKRIKDNKLIQDFENFYENL